MAITPDGSHVYVANVANSGSAPENVTVIETATNTVVAGVDVSTLPTPFGPWGVTALPDGKKVYSNDGDDGEFVFEIDSDPTSPTFNQVTAVIPIGGTGPRGMESGMTPVGVRVYAALMESDEVVVIDPATNAIVARVPTGALSLPMRVSLNPLGTQLWVSLAPFALREGGAGEVLVFDTEKIELDPANAEIARITGFLEPAQIVFAPVRHFQCYSVDKKGSTKLAVKPMVKLEDQFGVKEKVEVADKPDFLCNPVVKNNEGNFVNPNNHLACYKIRGTKANLDVGISNQFGAQTLRLKDGKLLCVPSTKEVVVP